ncbi:MAG: ABC transporter ATP-binding protein, partial [Anaerolineae bacterium]
MGLFGGLDTEAYDRTYSDVELIRRIAAYFAPHRRRVLGTILFVAVVSLAGAGQPLVVSRGVGALEKNPSAA